MKPESLEIISESAEHTRLLGRCLGTRLTGGLTIRLYGGLGSGKTCFIQGLAAGLDVPEQYVVASPTYTLINEYPGRLPLVHVDLYRLSGSLDAESIGLWEFFDTEAVVAVEWAERLADNDWPAESLLIRLDTEGDTTRRIRIFGSGLDQGNLIKDLAAEWSKTKNNS